MTLVYTSTVNSTNSTALVCLCYIQWKSCSHFAHELWNLLKKNCDSTAAHTESFCIRSIFRLACIGNNGSVEMDASLIAKKKKKFQKVAKSILFCIEWKTVQRVEKNQYISKLQRICTIKENESKVQFDGDYSYYQTYLFKLSECSIFLSIIFSISKWNRAWSVPTLLNISYIAQKVFVKFNGCKP